MCTRWPGDGGSCWEEPWRGREYAKPGADARRWKKKPEVMAEIERLLEPDTAGDPISGLRWTRRTTAKIAAQLLRLRIRVSARTVARLLRKLHFSLRVNRKKIGPRHPLRDAQFARIHKVRRRFCRQGNPVISVDAKKRELVGNSRNPGSKGIPLPARTNTTFLRSRAQGVSILSVFYDPHANRAA